jgi:hypothetical protein
MHLTLAAPPERVGNLRLCQGYNNLLVLAFFEDCHIATFSQLARLAWLARLAGGCHVSPAGPADA